MRSKVTVVLLFLNVALFFYIFYVEKPWSGGRNPLDSTRRVLPPEVASMDSLTRTLPTGEVVKIKKNEADGKWYIVQPYDWPANRDAVEHIHNELQFLEHDTSWPVTDPATLADYGLARPAMTVEFTGAGKTYTLQIGDETKTGNRLYVLSPDRTRIHVVNRSLAESLSLPLNDLRNDTIFTILGFEVRSLNIQTAPPANVKVRVRRDTESRWDFDAPILARAAKTMVELTINKLNTLTAKQFVKDAEASVDRTGLNAPSLSVTLEGNSRRETLLIGKPTTVAEEFYARLDGKPVVFTMRLPEELRKVLERAQETLRDVHVIDFDPATVTALTIVAPGQPEIALQKLESVTATDTPAAKTPAAATPPDRWQVVTRVPGQAPVTVAGDAGVIGDLLKKIQALSARKFLTDAPSNADTESYGFVSPERQIVLQLNTGGGLSGKDASTLTLEIGTKANEPGTAYARLTNPPYVYEVLPDILDATPPISRYYRQRQLRELPDSARLTSIALVDLSNNTPIYTQTLKEGDRNWDAAVAAEPEAMRPALQAVLAQLRSLRAQNLISETFSPDHADTPQGSRPWRFRLDYTIAFNNDAATATSSSLMLTERLGGASQLAGTQDFGGMVFNLEQPMIDALFTLIYRPKNDPGPSPAPAPATTPETPPAETPPTTPAKS